MSSFQATTPNARVGSVEAGRSIDVPYSVTNISGSSLRGAFSTKTAISNSAGWYTIKPDSAANFGPGSTQQVTVTVAPPLNAAAQDYSFRFRVGLSGEEDADFAEAPDVTFTVVAASKKRLPWVPIAIAAAVLVAIIVAVIYFVTPKPLKSAWCPQSDWTSSYGLVHLTCAGSTASGTYGYGTVTGNLSSDGTQLSGTFENNLQHRQGVFAFTIGADGQSFTGGWSFDPMAAVNARTPWTGTRR